MEMTMTHYMELLATNQPWNLLIFMAVPVILAETIAVTELFILFGRNLSGGLRKLNKFAGIIAGFYFLGIFVYLFINAVIPLTVSGQWRGIADVIAVGFYLSGVIPLLGMSLLEIGLLGRHKTEEGKLKLHATFVAIFLVVAHVAMIFGMLSPSVFQLSHMQM
ncbi:permease [Candidatus Formimonas warabiya]|uniref:Permease n=2 Tax=Formimonas warabiya TaxID=1761012 RepID=A0A3G1L070_FORW1|nr:permease [Candidatus Formimonas warabiya]